jgi:hypothetical protein
MPDLTPTQQATLRTFIDATPELAAQPNSPDGNYEVARLLNLAAVPAFVVWNPTAPLDKVQEAVTWANLTPTDAADSSQLWQNRSDVCQGKQFNLQMLLTRPSGTIRGDLSRVRTGLQDALTNVPSGTGGALQDAGWGGASGVRGALLRDALLVEKVFATGTGTSASPATMTYVGTISPSDVQQARAQ